MGTRLTPRLGKNILADNLSEILVIDDLFGGSIAVDISLSSEIYADAGDEIHEDILKQLDFASIKDPHFGG